MKKYILILLMAFNLVASFSTPSISAPNNQGLRDAVYNPDRPSSSAQGNAQPIKAFDRLLIRLTELFNMAREFIYLLSAFVLLSYIYEWLNAGGMKKEDFIKLAWFMVALTILGMARSFAEFAVGGDVEFINEIEERYYNETGERIVIMGNSIE